MQQNSILEINRVAEAALYGARIVKFGTTDYYVAQAAANTDLLIGVSKAVDRDANGVPGSFDAAERVDIVHLGFAEVLYGGIIARGEYVTADANGKAVKLTDAMLATGAIQSIGVCMESGVDGDLGCIFVYPQKVSKFDAVTASAAELNYNDITTLGTAQANKTVTADANIDVTGLRNLTVTGSFIIGSADMNEADLEKLDGITNGTQAANKAVVADANVNTGVSKVTELHIGATGFETQVTATAAELNTLDLTTGAGTLEASKAIVVNADKHVDEINTASLKLGATGATVAVGSTAAELNLLDLSAQTETIDSGVAASVTKRITKIDNHVTGAGAITLAAPDATMLGQVKIIEMTVDGGDVTLSLANIDGGTAATTATFDDVGECLSLVGGVSKWHVIGEAGVTLS